MLMKYYEHNFIKQRNILNKEKTKYITLVGNS